MPKISNKGKLTIGLLTFVLITPLLIFYILENSNVFDTRSRARSANLTDELKKADLNSDNAVSIADYSLWLGYFRDYKNSKTYKQAADLDGNGIIGIADYAEWLRLFRKYKEWVKEPIDQPITNPTEQVGYVGTGKDGDISVVKGDGNVNINTNKLITSGGRATSCPDAPQYNAMSFGSDGKSVVVNEAIETACLKAGDEVMLINLQGTAASVNNVGNYESLIVSSVSGKTINFTTAKKKHYGVNISDDTGIGLTLADQRVMVQRVPNYKNVTIASEAVLTGSGFDGKKGGVLFFRASGTVNVGGTITVAGKGYSGGVGDAVLTTHTPSGESLFVDATNGGYGGATTTQKVALNTAQDLINGHAGTYSGGGGAGTWGSGGDYGNYAITGTAGAGNSTSVISGGGGGGGSATGGVYLAYEWWHSGHGGGGGGGGYATGGTGGAAGDGGGDRCNNGGTGSKSGSGSGGSAKFVYTNPDGSSTTDGYAGNGGGGAADYGDSSLTKLFFGSGGGAGGTGESGGATIPQTPLKGGNGGNGGGIILISASNITVSGSITSVGSNGTSGTTQCTARSHYNCGTSGGGGGGAGGSIRLEGTTLTLGNGLVRSTGGSGATTGSNCGGGNGGNGRIAVYSGGFSGTTNPPAQTSNI